jgi:AbiTii-like protein
LLRDNRSVAGRDRTLIAQIEKDALGDSVPLASALRKCVVLGGKSGSEELRDWATRELNGYPDLKDLPEYRKVAAPLRLDGIAGNYKVTGEELPPMALPDFARETISNEVPLNGGVAELDELSRMPEVKLSPPGASDLALYMNSQSGSAVRHINSIYWQVSPAAVRGVLDQIRTALTRLVAELLANMATAEEIPSAEAANQAVQVIVTGKRSQVRVTTAQADSPGAVAIADAREENVQNPPESGFWTGWRKIGAFIVGLATIAGAAVAIIQLFD